MAEFKRDIQEEWDEPHIRDTTMWSHLKNDSPAVHADCDTVCYPIGTISETQLAYVCGSCRKDGEPIIFYAKPFTGGKP